VAVKTVVSLEDFLQLPEQGPNGEHYELDEGELITLSPAGRPHSRRVGVIDRYLAVQLSEDKYDILVGDIGLIMGRGPRPTVRGADIAVVVHTEEQAEGMLTEPPFLIVEVISPSNTPEDVERKRIQYLDFGVPEVWIVYEKTQTIHVFQPGEKFVVVGVHDRFPCKLGFSVDVKELFR
jgi:Uma2 family endonuclease